MPRLLAALALLFVALTNGGCATILNDDHQPVAFSSEPPGAIVSVDGVQVGTTPTTALVKRKGGDKLIQIDLAGYKTVQMTLNNRIHGAGFGNLIIGGVIGIGVDAISGRAGSYKDSVHVIMERGRGTVFLDDDGRELDPEGNRIPAEGEDQDAAAPTGARRRI